MSPQSKIVPFRANEEDREKLEYLKQKLDMRVAPIIRLALEKLYELERRREK